MADTVISVLLKGLKKNGCRYIFGLPAAQLAVFMDGASRDPYFTYVTTRHEEACGHMAHAISKITDTVGVCFATVGPGAMNMVPGVAAAWADNVPLLVLTGNNQSYATSPDKELLQSSNQVELYRSITKWNASIRDPERTAEILERALYIARSGRPGPVHLDIPCDIGTSPCHDDNTLTEPRYIPRPVPCAQEMERVAEWITTARRPVLLAGGGVARSGGTQSFRKLIEITGFPATTTLNARGVVEKTCPTHIGSGGILGGKTVAQAMCEADLVLAVGCKFNSWTPVNKPPLYPTPDDQKIIQVEIDPAYLGINVPVDLGLVADARAFTDLLVETLSGRSLSVDKNWVKTLLAAYEAYRNEVNAIADARHVEGAQTLNEAAVAREISTLIPEDAIIAIDGGQTAEWTHTFVHPRDPRSHLFNPGMGHLGMGLPAANAAKLAYPDRPVICVTGDGAMGCTIQELETAVRHNLGIVVVVCNDSHWGMYKPMGEMIFENNNFGTKLSGMSFADIARGFGCHAERVESLDALPEAFARAMAAGRPAVVEVIVGYTMHPIDDFWPQFVLKDVALEPVEI